MNLLINAGQSIKGTVIDLPDMLIKQEQLAVLRKNNKIQLIIPENIQAEWNDDKIDINDLYESKIIDPRTIELTLNENLELSDSIILENMQLKLLTEQ